MIDLVKNINDSNNGNILDRLYCYLKGEREKNLMFINWNLFNVLRQMGISPRETILNYDKGNVLYPAWFY